MSTRFFSGFSLRDEAHFFAEFASPSSYCVGGFSYGAIKAAEFAASHEGRIDLLQLFSPAFFQQRPEKFKRLQMMGFSKDPSAYIRQFRANSFAPYAEQELQDGEATPEALHELLYYEWKAELLHKILAKGIRIEVYLGAQDKIIDPKAAREFFLPYATLYTLSKANHLLQENNR